MTDIDHDRAITTITETLGATVLSRTFQMYPDHFFDQENEPRPRRQPATKPAPIGTPLPPAEPDRPIIDWSSHRTSSRTSPCIHCGLPPLLLDDAGRPAHKVCAETALAQLLQTDQGSAA
jgi:hypothetical protein